MTDHVGPYSGKLAELLSRARPPGTTRGVLSVSERLEAALREVDTATLSLQRSLDRAAFYRGQLRGRGAAAATTDPTEAARAELAVLGIEV